MLGSLVKNINKILVQEKKKALNLSAKIIFCLSIKFIE